MDKIMIGMNISQQSGRGDCLWGQVYAHLQVAKDLCCKLDWDMPAGSLNAVRSYMLCRPAQAAKPMICANAPSSLKGVSLIGSLTQEDQVEREALVTPPLGDTGR